VMKQRLEHFTIPGSGRKFTDITERARKFVTTAQIDTGLLTLFIQHTSASLLIQENADPDVLKDLEDAFAGFAPRAANYRHATEGPDDMPSHIRAALTQTSVSIPISGGAPVLGTWQAIYVFEHRDAPHRRIVVMHVVGE
jgi:secondary thiamine-phosphate synthase enzyme